MLADFSCFDFMSRRRSFTEPVDPVKLIDGRSNYPIALASSGFLFLLVVATDLIVERAYTELQSNCTSISILLMCCTSTAFICLAVLYLQTSSCSPVWHVSILSFVGTSLILLGFVARTTLRLPDVNDEVGYAISGFPMLLICTGAIVTIPCGLWIGFLYMRPVAQALLHWMGDTNANLRLGFLDIEAKGDVGAPRSESADTSCDEDLIQYSS